MKIRLSYLVISIEFIDLDGEYGRFEGGEDGNYVISIHKDLSGPALADTLLHEIAHLAYHLYAPSDEEGQVSSITNTLVEALNRNKQLREMVLENLK